MYILVCALCTATIAGNLLSAVVAAAQDPKVSIKLAVQNQTTNSELSPADNKDSALVAKPGDILKYVVTITNESEESQDNKNDFVSAKVISALPASIELVSNVDTREINEDLGTIKPGKTATKQFVVRVAAKDAGSIESKACFTGRYDAQNKPQSDCESAFVAVSVPAAEKPATPAPTTPAPVNNEAEAKPTETPEPAASGKGDLPTTGPSDLIAPLAALGTGGLAYTGRLIALKRRG
jgi:hypothetical protein